MNKQEKRDYLTKLLVDDQKCRSNYHEAWGSDETAERVAADLEPWLFGEKCIVEVLGKVLNSENELDNTEIFNFSYIAQHSAMLQLMKILSKRRDPSLQEIFGQVEEAFHERT